MGNLCAKIQTNVHTHVHTHTHADDAQHLIETKYKEPMKKVFKRSFVRVLIITVVSALIIVGGLCGISDTRAAASNASVPYPVNMDAIEEVYPLDSAAKEKLLSNGFIVLEDYKYDDIAGCYLSLLDKYDVSVFLTPDAMLHVFHVIHDAMLQDVERQYLYDSLELLLQDMQEASVSMYEDTPPELAYVKEAARRNVIFFTVACKLLDDTYLVPDYAEDDVTEYVGKILNHSLTEYYPGDDWTQYEPRGHYEGDSMLEKYFRCMKWLSRHIFRIEDSYYAEDSNIEIIQAAMVSEMLQDSPDDTQLWAKIYNVTTLLVGPADSVTPVMVQQAVANVFGESFTIPMLEDITNIEKLREEFQKPEYPESQIIPVPLEYPDQIPPKYIQFMGERFTPDSYVFQQVSEPYVPGRPLPKGLDIMATMLGSNRAGQLLEEEKETYPELESQHDKLRGEFEDYTEEDWQKNVYYNWLYALEPLLVEFDQSYPLFMQNTAWQDEKLNTALSSWTQLRHDYLLYTKPPYPILPIVEGYGYVEPVPEFYHRLASLCRKIDTEFSSEGIDIVISDYSYTYHDHLTGFADALDTLEAYARKELNNEPLTSGEQSYIHRFGGELKWLLLPWREEEIIKPMLVVDVCTHVSGSVLHEGVGEFNPIIVVYEEPDGTSRAGIGFVLSYYEFIEDDFTRITDSEWKEWVENDTLPPRPSWAESFLYSAGDNPAPSVTSTSPEADGTDVAVDTMITATFSGAMDASTITTGSFTVVTDSTPLSGSVSYDSGTYTATFTPSANLSYGTTYTATLSTAITNVAGNPLASAYSWNFTTASAPPGAVTVSIDAPGVVASDSDFQANVNISEVVDFKCGYYDVSFDASVLRLDDVTSGLIGSTTIPVDVCNEISSGTWWIHHSIPGLSGVSGSGYLAVLHFHVIGSEGDSSTISLSNGMLLNSQAEEIPSTWVGDSVDVTSVLPGDANGDGNVNALDITKVKRIVAGLDAETPGADANQDGSINALDITKVKRIIVGLD